MTTWSLAANTTTARLFAAESPDGEGGELVREFNGDAEHRGDEFASTVLDFLERSLQEHHFDSLAIAAPEDFLASIRSRASRGLKSVLVRTVSQDLTNHSPREISHALLGTCWIVVADRSRARFLTHNPVSSEPFCEEADLISPESRIRESETGADRPGRFALSGGRRASTEPHQDHRHETAEQFSREIVEYLEHIRSQRGLERLVIVAPPLLLGELRKKLPEMLRKAVIQEIHKDWTKLPIREIAAALTATLEE